LGIIGERSPTHSRDHYGDIQDYRLVRKATAEHCLGRALFPIALEWNPSERAWKKRKIVKGRPAARAQGAIATDAVQPCFCLGLDVFDNVGLEGSAGLECPALDPGIVRHRSEGLLP